MKLLVSLLMTAVLAGCVGTNFTFDQARQVKVGMTEAQVTQIMGAPPYSVKPFGESQVWLWTHVSVVGSRTISFEMKDGKVVFVPEIPSVL